MKFLLHDNQLSERGTTQAVWQYGLALQALDHEITLAFNQELPGNNEEIITAISADMAIFGYSQTGELSRFGQSFDAAYFIKSGEDDGLVIPNIRNVVHAVFQAYEPHGDYYAYVSDWLADNMRGRVVSARGLLKGRLSKGLLATRRGCENAFDFDYIPHISNMPEPDDNLRRALNIPEDAFVIVRYGGYETFDIPWVHQILAECLTDNPRWYFIGINTRPFLDHQRCLYLPPVTNRQDLANLLGSSDIFLNARASGESFGLANVEALQIGLPVLSWSGGWDRNHVQMLNPVRGLYANAGELESKLASLAIGKDPFQDRRLKIGAQYRPSAVVSQLAKALTGESR
jgi:glycosyltransferase involved in cell wall biosynthesis